MIASSPGRSRLVRILVRRSSRATPPIWVGVPRLRSSVGSRISVSILPPVLLWRAVSVGKLYATVATEPVTDSSYRLQRPYAKRAVDLFPEVADVDLDDVGAVSWPKVPSPIKQLVVAEDLSRASHEGLEQG